MYGTEIKNHQTYTKHTKLIVEIKQNALDVYSCFEIAKTV